MYTFHGFMGCAVNLLIVINDNVTVIRCITLFCLQADTEELSETEEHKNAKTILEATVLEDQDFDCGAVQVTFHLITVRVKKTSVS